jgi:hypothetical protein
MKRCDSPRPCNLCEEQSAVLTLTATKLDGTLLDRVDVCTLCAEPFLDAGLQLGCLENLSQA